MTQNDLHDFEEIFLLDIDSVLVRPLGYREALRDTVNHFGLRMNQEQGAITPTYEEIDVFEATGFTSEWDSIPMCLAAFFKLAGEWGPPVWRDTLTGTMVLMARTRVRFPRPDYAAVVRAIAAEPDGGKLPAQKALDYFLAHTRPAQSEAVLRELLGSPADIRTPTTRTFQHYTLGSRAFAMTYGFGPDFAVESYLLRRDEPLLSGEGRARLLDSGVRHAIYTARPSHPPESADSFGYAPEAEMARALVGLEASLLVGFGHVAWLAEHMNVTPNAYTKPSPVQALAAIGAAWTGAVEASLWSACALAEDGELGGPLATLLAAGPVRVTVFEDTPGGVRAVRRAGDLLRAAGVDVTVRAVGVSDSAVKRAALAPLTDMQVGEVNAGLVWALKESVQGGV
ncbi:MAG: hypothetical protein JXB47_14950 [Anaerolineae bacterium]|nr:hypothetical protein [Anaerolineae bacterium]